MDVCIRITPVVLAESYHGNQTTECNDREKTENKVKKEVIFDCFVLFCTSLYTYMYSATTASISCWNFRQLPMTWSTSKKWLSFAMSFPIMSCFWEVRFQQQSLGVSGLRHLLEIYLMRQDLWLLGIILSFNINIIFLYLMWGVGIA